MLTPCQHDRGVIVTGVVVAGVVVTGVVVAGVVVIGVVVIGDVVTGAFHVYDAEMPDFLMALRR